MMRFAAALLCVSAAAAQTPEPVTAWIRENAIPLKTVEAGNGFEDLKPLRAVIGDARIVALGEATHGTREFFQLKHRMLEYLVDQLGFAIFSIEANMPEAYALNDYVLHGRGDPAALLKGMYFWTWNTDEVFTMIQWMRDYNLSHARKVQFTGFDMQTPNVAAEVVRRFVNTQERAYVEEVTRAVDMAIRAARQTSGGSFGVATSRLPVEALRGHRLRFSGWIRTEGVTRPWAGLWMRIDGKPGEPNLGFDNMAGRPVTGTTSWKEYSIEMAVPAEATALYFGALLPGDGKAWFDSFRFESDGKPLTVPAELDLDFEQNPPRGFFLGGNGYAVSPDAEVAHSGKSSLRMAYRGSAVEDTGPSAADAAKLWETILEHLTGNAEKYAAGGAAKSDIDWAVHNARVVVQAMNLRSTGENRDRDMAANIGWILEQNPEAKVVLWAHNGHVRTSSTGNPEPMGLHLRDKYGDALRVFGFAFNQGTFRAVESGKGVIEHTVGAAPPDTLDAALTSAGLPLLALNLRALPPDGEVSSWFRTVHRARLIGAVYSVGYAEAYLAPVIAPEAYDVLLFVDKTTPSRTVRPLSSGPVEVTEVQDEPGTREVRDRQSGVSFRLPSNWRFADVLHGGPNQSTVRLVDDGAGQAGSLYYEWHETPVAELLDSAALHLRVEPKVKQRRAEGRPDYRIDAEACERRQINGRPALACVGQYTARSGEKMSEYLVWVISPRVNALFFGSSAAKDFEEFRPNLEFVAQTLQLPE